MTDYSAFPRIEGLVDLACRNGVDVRPTLLRVLTDLYVQAPSHTPDEEAQYKELALRLIDNVDAPTRNAIAGRLAGYPRAPLAIVRRLKELGATVPAAPAAPPAPHVKLREDFFAADSYERQLMLTNLDAAGASLVAPPAAVETCKRIEAAVLAGNIGDFIGLIESALTLPRAIAEKVAYDNGGEPLVIVARALGMTRTVLERVLLLLNPAIGQSVERVYGLAALHDEITAATAESMLAIWRGTAPRRGAYQPALHDDEKRSARTTMTTTARHQTHRRSDALAARFRNSGR
jgi:hypothetical protein